jgi:arabinosyltransferase C
MPEPNRRGLAATAVALAAVALSVVAAVGPADSVRTTYSWPSGPLSSPAPPRLWYTPLLLSRHVPERISAVIPCALSPPLSGAGRAVTVLSTTRHPERSGGLEIVRRGSSLAIKVGGTALAHQPLPTAPSCMLHLTLASDRWTLTGGARTPELAGDLPVMPRVTGLFSELDLSRPGSPTIAVTTTAHRSMTTLRQKLASGLAAGCAIIAALLASDALRRRRPGRALDGRSSGPRLRPQPVDAVVGLVLLGWWILSPAFWDDGWVAARQRMYPTTGGFASYYDGLGANLPNGYWLEWLQHWLYRASEALVAARVPTLLLLLLVWVLCRWIGSRVLPSRAGDRLAAWTMAASFLAFALAWGMTLRPEPVTAVLVAGVLGGAAWFRERPSPGPLALVAVLVPLALTGHHAGVVALAPVLVVVPELRRYLRREAMAALALVLASVALLVVLASLGADIGQRLADVDTARAANSQRDAWHDELARYAHLDDSPWATPLRRGSVALIAVVVLGFLLRDRRERAVPALPTRTLIAGLLLLALAPSKWPWHFGALVAPAALAAGAEAVRFRSELAGAARLSARALAVLAATFAAAAWAWGVRSSWNVADLRALSWSLGFEEWLPLQAVAALLPMALVVALALGVVLLRRSAAAVLAAPARAAAAASMVLLVPLIAFTLAILLADTVKTGSWTLARQNLDALAGEAGCGLADDARVVPPDGSGTPVALSQLVASESSPSLVLPNLLLYFPCVHLPRLENGVAEVPSYVVTPSTSPIPVRYSTSPFYGVLDLYELARLPSAPPDRLTGIEVFAVRQDVPGGATAAPAAKTFVS